MSELLYGYTTEAGTTFKKVRDKRGATRYFKDGKPVKSQAFSGGQASFRKPILDDNGDLPAGVREADSVAELERVTGIPFSTNVMRPINVDTKRDAMKAEGNRFLGFWDANPHIETRKEAAKEYLEFRNELADVENPYARATIKSRYNIGGS